MIPVSRTDLTDAQWQAWRAAAKEAMDNLVNQYHPGDDVNLKDELYKQAMPFLLKLFHGKCAYCETVIASNQPGDVEHYRPKGRLRDDKGKILKVRIANTEVDHPGYWWLAYDWRNLLPSCIDCNRRRRHGDDSVAAGKADFFDVRGKRAVLPSDDLAQEHALLLDPSEDHFDPKQHFTFMGDGTIKPTTDEARYSIDLLGLNLRETLVAQREKAYLEAEEALSYLLALATAGAPESKLARTRRQINDILEGRSEYSAFARQALDEAREKVFRASGVRIDFPRP